MSSDGGIKGVTGEEHDEGGSSITVTSPGVSLGDGECDFGHGGTGDPPVEEPSGDKRSIEGVGDGDGVSERGDGGGRECELERGVSGREAPGEIEVGRGSSEAEIGDDSVGSVWERTGVEFI